MIAAIDAVLDGRATNAFVATRPPGHHAEKTRAMGFCFFGNIAIGALHALERRGLSRVAIVDFDVHHGNGTQDILWDEPARFSSPASRCRFSPAPARPRNGGVEQHPQPAPASRLRRRPDA
jgi:acetoin utilization deacetylase AcuC-like enzyme